MCQNYVQSFTVSLKDLIHSKRRTDLQDQNAEQG